MVNAMQKKKRYAYLLSMFSRTLSWRDGSYVLLKESSTWSSLEVTTLNSVLSNLYKYDATTY